MSFINFLLEGSEMNDWEYDRYNYSYADDEVKIINNSAIGNFAGVITKIEADEDSKLTRIVDEVVQVVSVPENIRNDMLAFWKSKKIKALACAALVSLSAAALAVFSVGVLPTYIIIAAVIFTIPVVILLFTRSKDAQMQIKAWKDPIIDCQNMRKKIGEKGENAFLYLWDNQPENSMVTQSENKNLWNNWANSFFSTYANDSMTEDTITDFQLAKFMCTNPLGKKILEYAKNDEPYAEHINELSKIYSKMEDDYLSFRDHRKNLLSAKEVDLEQNQRDHTNARENVAQTLSFFTDNDKKHLSNLINTFREEVKKVNKTYAPVYANIKPDQPIRVRSCDLQKERDLKELDLTYEPKIVAAKIKNQELTERYKDIYDFAINQIDDFFKERANKIEESYKQQMSNIKPIEKENKSQLVKLIIEISKAFLNQNSNISHPIDLNDHLSMISLSEDLNLQALYHAPDENFLNALNPSKKDAYEEFFTELQNRFKPKNLPDSLEKVNKSENFNDILGQLG
jgi:hypothetical protein